MIRLSSTQARKARRLTSVTFALGSHWPYCWPNEFLACAQPSTLFIAVILSVPQRCLLIALAGFTCLAGAQDYPRTGSQAELSTLAHQVSGTATIVSSNSIRVDNFNFDGNGIAVYFYLGTNNTHTAFSEGTPIGPNLLGTAHVNDTVTVSLPAGQSLDGFHAISVWCVPAGANFGSGTFQPYIESIKASDGVTSLTVTGSAGTEQVYHLQGATNTTDWIELATQTNSAGSVYFEDTNSLPTRLYRVAVD